MGFLSNAAYGLLSFNQDQLTFSGLQAIFLAEKHMI